MRSSRAIAAVAMFAVCLTCAPAVSRADERSGVLRGKFVRLAEKTVGEREYLAIVVQPAGRDAHVMVLFARSKADILHRARGLKAGQKVEIPFVREGRHMWVRRVEAQRRTDRPDERERRERRDREHAERRDRDRAEARHHRERRDRDKAEGERRDAERPERREGERRRVERRDRPSAEIRELAAIVRRLAHGLERIQREMDELRAENARLRRLLRAHRELDERRDRPKTDRPKTDRPKSDRPKADRPRTERRDAPREE